jgi:hypothetical protein
VPQSPPTIRDLLDRLEKFYGRPAPGFPVDPYEFLVWWYCGYPASDRACGKGWERLTNDVGVEPEKLLKAAPAKLAAALQAGGLFPDLGAERLKETAMRVLNEFGGDLRAVLMGPIAQARKTLKKLPQHCQSWRRSDPAVCRNCSPGGSALQLRSRSDSDSEREGESELRSELSGSSALDRRFGAPDA